MKDKEITRKINLEMAFKGKVETDLEKILVGYDQELLSEIYSYITNKEVNYNKNTMVKKLYKLLTDKNIIEKLLNRLLENEYREIKRIIEQDGIIQDDYIKLSDYSFIRYYGITHLFNDNDKVYVVIPKQIMDIIKNMNFDEYKLIARENTKVNDLAYSMVNLYGVVDVLDFESGLAKYYNYTDEKDVNLDAVFATDRFNSIRIIEENDSLYMVKEEFLDDDNIHIIYKIIDRISYNGLQIKDIELEELLKYKDNFYYKPTKQTESLVKYLQKNGLTKEQAESIVAALIQAYRLDYGSAIDFINDIFYEEGFNFNSKNIEEVITYINNILNHCILWGNNGWTTAEIILGKAELK